MRRTLDVAALTVGAAIGLIGAAVALDWAVARLVAWSDRRGDRRALGGAR